MWFTVLISVLELLAIAAIMFMLPRMTRKGLLFGVYVGSDIAGGREAERLTRAWGRFMALTIVLSLAIGVVLAVSGRTLWALIVPDLILLAGCLRCYYASHRAARALVAARGGPAPVPPPGAASLSAPRTGLAFPAFVTVICAAIGLAVVLYAWASYGDLPDRVPTHFSGSGTPDGWSDKSFASVMALPLGALFMGVGMGVLTCLIARAKRALRLKDKGISLAAQERFRTSIVVLIGIDALVVTVMLAVMSYDSIRIGLGHTNAMSSVVTYLGIGLTVFTLAAIIYIARRFGQGGARLEGPAAELPLTDGLADNSKWKLGALYFNRDDPSMFVEHRFGLGYTLNFANAKGVAFLVIFMLLAVVLPIVLAIAQ